MVSDFFARSRRKEVGVREFRKYVFGLKRWDLQTSYFTHDGVIVDFIGRFERLYLDFDYVCSLLDIENRLQRTNSTKHEHYSVYYDVETREKVAKLFKEDIDFLGYRF